MRKSQVPKKLIARMEGLLLTLVVLNCLRMGVHRAMLIGLLAALIATSLTSCSDGPQSEEPTQLTQAPEATATPMPTPDPTATPMPTPEPTATPMPTPEPTATPMPTPEPTPRANGNPHADTRANGNPPTPEPTATPMPTSQRRRPCRHQSQRQRPCRRQSRTATPMPTPEPTATPMPTPEPTATPMPTPEPTATPMPTPAVEPDGVEGCEDVLTREHSLGDILTDEDLIRCLHEELQ